MIPMLSVARIEAASHATWPALETVEDGRWCARFAEGFSGRSNAIWSLDPTDNANARNRLEMLCAQYDKRNLAPTVRVTPLTGIGLLEALKAEQWPAIKTSLVLSRPLDTTNGMDPDISLFDATDPTFLEAQTQLQGFTPERAAVFGKLLAAINTPACGLVLTDNDMTPLASALCVESEGIIMLYDVITASHARGKGIGRRIVASALSWAAENGASHAALQVQGDNAPAIALYLASGFTFRYPYHYRRKPEQGDI